MWQYTFTAYPIGHVLPGTDKHPTSLNARQRIMLNKLLDGFDGKLTSGKWATITKSSQDTAGRDIQDLILKGI